MSFKYLNNIFDICMSRKLTLPQLKKYDITQKVIEALADSESRAILFSIIRKGNTAAELSNKLKIPLSSVYKKLSDLEELTLIEVEKWMLSDKGRKFKVYIEAESARLIFQLKSLNPFLHWCLIR